MISTADFKNGMVIVVDNEPYQITKGEYIPYDEAEVARKAIDEKFQNS